MLFQYGITTQAIRKDSQAIHRPEKSSISILLLNFEPMTPDRSLLLRARCVTPDGATQSCRERLLCCATSHNIK